MQDRFFYEDIAGIVEMSQEAMAQMKQAINRPNSWYGEADVEARIATYHVPYLTGEKLIAFAAGFGDTACWELRIRAVTACGCKRKQGEAANA